MTSRHSLFIGLLGLPLILGGSMATADTNDPPPIPDRYLLVVDTSSPMRARAEALENAVSGLVVSGMLGEIHDGDELGVWTYNSDLHTGEFELVTWNAAAREEIAGGILEFVGKQRFRKSTDFGKVMPHLMDVVAASKRITVILFSDGDEVIEGTPFDDAIAVYFREHADTLKKQDVPIVTVLRGYEGKLIGHTLSFPPWPVEFPEFPPEPVPDPTPIPIAEPFNPKPTVTPPDLSRTLVTTNKGPIVFGEPLIVSGPVRKSAPPAAALADTNRIEPDTNRAPAAVPAAASAPMTNAPARVQPERPEAAEPPGSDPEADSPSRLHLILVLGGGGALVAVAVLLWMRRPRARRPASLITRSMNKKRRSD